MKSKINLKNTLESINSFWCWFVKNATRIAQNPESQRLIKSLDRRVAATWPSLTWEYGPDVTDGWYFALSPNLNRDLVNVAKSAIRNAPTIPGWRFYPFRQRKLWDGQISITTKRGVMHFNSSDWKYVLLEYPDGKTEVFLAGKEAELLDEEDRWLVSAIVLEGILGEECVLEKIDIFAFEPVIDKKFVSRALPLENLPCAFNV